MFVRYFNNAAKKASKDLLSQKQIKPIVCEGFKANFEWMNKEIKKIPSTPNSYTKLDAQEFESAMQASEELEAGSIYYR